MYAVHITFDNGNDPAIRFRMTRQEYCEEMRKWQIGYDLEMGNVEEFKNGDRLIFFNAYERTGRRLLKNIEGVKSRARHYSRKMDRAGETIRFGGSKPS